MPNTLGHIGLQGPASLALFRGVDPKWIYAGVLVPDVPWILQRAMHVLWPALNPYDLRIYAIAQSSFAVSLILCAAIALCSIAPGRVFAVLALNALLHLLLDASQTKWGSGVHLFAPVSWELLSIDLFVPESLPTYVLTAAGLGFMIWSWRRGDPGSVGIAPVTTASGRYAWAAVLLACYVAMPFALGSGPEAADNHSVQTLRAYGARSGNQAVFDRTRLVWVDGAPYIRTFAGEDLAVVGAVPPRSGTVSVRAVFTHPDTLAVVELREHVRWPRDWLSMLAIILILTVWARALTMAAVREGNEHGCDP